jgi:putative ubiquitin-RnfH superfamily antitoxin RatB of RatAB toxin-antitoxin module
MKITVLYSPAPRVVHEVTLELPTGALVADAVAAVQPLPDFAQVPWASASLGVWNLKASPQQPLQDQDRVEIYRPLRVDPKVARRERFAKQGARTSGLFAKRRPGGKAGYY